MFRFTIRELLILTVTAGLLVGWWLDHRALATVREDAVWLARYGGPHWGACGNVAGNWQEIANKYWPQTPHGQSLVIQDQDENELGIHIEQ